MEEDYQQADGLFTCTIVMKAKTEQVTGMGGGHNKREAKRIAVREIMMKVDIFGDLDYVRPVITVGDLQDIWGPTGL